MSHFAVLVITEDHPDKVLEDIMMPYHEFECTGIDKFVQTIDITNDALNEFNSQTVLKAISPEGEMVDYYDERFYREMTLQEEAEYDADSSSFHKNHDTVRAKENRNYPRIIDLGSWEKKEFPKSAFMSFKEFIEYWYSYDSILEGTEPDLADKHQYGYMIVDSNDNVLKVFDRTNPNKKWDWYQIGGRWSGFFKPYYNPDEDPNNQETCFICRGTGTRDDMIVEHGCNGCNGTGIKTKWPSQWSRIGDQLQLKDLPLEALRNEQEEKALKLYDRVTAIIAGRDTPDWDVLREKHNENMSAVRAEFNEHPVILDLKEDKDLYRQMMWNLVDYLKVDAKMTRLEVARQARASAISTFAVIKDGKWYERGEMGWFGVSHNEKDSTEWNQEFAKLLDGLPQDTWLTVVDCHI